MTTDLFDQLRTFGDRLDATVSPVALSELRATGTSIDVDVAPSGTPRRWGRVLAIAAAVGLVVGAIAVINGRHPSSAPVDSSPAPATTAAPGTTAAPATTAVPTATTAPVVVSTLAPPPAGLTLAFGGSVMQGAATDLAGLGVFTREPLMGQQAQMTAVRARMPGGLSPMVVLQIGEYARLDEPAYDRLLDTLADRARVVVLTVHGPSSWIAANNDFIRSLPARHANIVVVDWDKAVTSGDVTGLTADGMHLGAAAVRPYALIVAKAVDAPLPGATTTTSTTTPPADGTCVWRASDDGHDGGFGHQFAYVGLTNVGRHTCTLPTVTKVTGTWLAAGATVIGAEDPSSGPGPATVAPGVRLSLTLTTTAIDGCTVMSTVDKVTHIDITLSDGSTVAIDLATPIPTKCGIGYTQLTATS
jgi:hypothetical protein